MVIVKEEIMVILEKVVAMFYFSEKVRKFYHYFKWWEG
jgi:hypothetical protein